MHHIEGVNHRAVRILQILICTFLTSCLESVNLDHLLRSNREQIFKVVLSKMIANLPPSGIPFYGTSPLPRGFGLAYVEYGESNTV